MRACMYVWRVYACMCPSVWEMHVCVPVSICACLSALSSPGSWLRPLAVGTMVYDAGFGRV